ncbi:MAG: nucleotide exchange factor GrpE [Micrococcales bacterium]
MSENETFGAEESPEIHDATSSQSLSGDTSDTDELTVEDILSAATSEQGNKEAELIEDLRRLQAEFVNYKNRVERDRELARTNAIADVLRAMLPALDDLARAEAHGDLDGSPFAAVVTKLRNATEKFGVQAFGAKGETFDPALHNALVQTPNPEVSETVIADVIEAGYQIGDRIIRPAMVAVFIPA